jgi:MFS family permease
VLFGYAWARTRHPDRVGTRLLLLALLTQVHVIGAIVAVVLTTWELLDCRQWRRAAWLGVAAVVVGLAATAWQIAGSASHAYSSPATSLVRALANGFAPDYARLRDQPRQRLAGFGLWVLAVAALLADRSWRAMLLYSGLAAVLAALCLLVYPGYRWHHGWFFLFYLLALWVAPGRGRFSSPVVSLLLAVQTLIGAYAVYDDFVHPYSNGAAAPADLRERGLANLPLIAVSVRPDDFAWNLDEAQPVLAELPGQRLYDPNAGAFVPYYTHFYVGYFGLIDRREMMAELDALSTRSRSPVAVIAVLHGGRAEPPAPLRLVAELPPTHDFGEHLAVWLYEAEPPR